MESKLIAAEGEASLERNGVHNFTVALSCYVY